jgi:hypothetical protein
LVDWEDETDDADVGCAKFSESGLAWLSEMGGWLAGLKTGSGESS